MKVLVTGCNSGLGKYISNTMECIEVNRSNRNSIIQQYKTEGVDLIIHCAFGGQGGYTQNIIGDYFKYVDDNILFTKELTEIPHKKIVYISSLAVYEKEYMNYKHTKLYAESIITNLGKSPLILRCPAMLGKYMRPNNVYNLITNRRSKLSLSKESNFNYVLHSDILNFIRFANNWAIKGVIDFTSTENITLEEITNILKAEPEYGNYTFNTPLVSNRDLVKYNKSLNKTSKEVFNQFIEQI
jgi:nucleoside-diphosphate-sugar epimerase